MPAKPGSGRLALMGALDALKLPALINFISFMGFGPLARDSGFGFSETVLAGALVWGLPGQVAMVELFALGAPALAIVLACSLANARFLPMTVAAMPLLAGARPSLAKRLFLAHLLSVNTWVGLRRKAPHLSPQQLEPYYVGFALCAIWGSLMGAATGFLLAEAVPPSVAIVLIFLNPTYFALVFAETRERCYLLALAFGAALGPLVHVVSPDWGLLVAGTAAGTLGFLLDHAFRRREPDHDA